jgi:hypothetical protein
MSNLRRRPPLLRAAAAAAVATGWAIADPAPALAASEAEYSCRFGQTVRRVELRFAGEGARMPCEVVYWRDSEQPGHSEVLWHAQRDAQFCRDKTQEVVERLQAGGWSCEAISGAEAGPEVARREEEVVPALAPAARLSVDDLAAAIEADVRRLNELTDLGRFEAQAFTLGDLDHDQAADGAALLTYHGEGAPNALYLLAYLHEGGHFRPVARTRLLVGDGLLEGSITTIDGGAIQVEARAGESGQRRQAAFLLIDGDLVEAGEGQLSAGRETTIR